MFQGQKDLCLESCLCAQMRLSIKSCQRDQSKNNGRLTRIKRTPPTDQIDILLVWSIESGAQYQQDFARQSLLVKERSFPLTDEGTAISRGQG